MQRFPLKTKILSFR